MNGGEVALAAIGLVGTILALVVTPLFKLLNANTKAQHSTTTALNALVNETAKGNQEAAQRNGHLAELQIEQAKLTEKMTKQAVDQVKQAIGVQNVQQMNVKSATIQEETVEHEQVNRKD